ncbi:uracil-xanthine permease family protein [Ruminococcaceae bacterium OttesenSCG-928-L11]|nr:uracil-xanthine permease family protein [Ruminococcaceae bacterium OttesenSCG-928-L11]
MDESLQLNTGKKLLLGFQHLFAMFGATVLVPALTGLNPSIALICAGIGTLLFHVITKHKVPAFLGSSFAYITALQTVIGTVPNAAYTGPTGISYAQGGIIVSGIVYLALSGLVMLVGTERIRKFLPPIVVGPVIVVIGVNLAPTGIAMAAENWWIALLVLAVIIGVSCFAKNFFKLVPILLGLVVGYIACLICDAFHLFAEPLVNLSLISEAGWFIAPSAFSLPKFDAQAILLIAPIAIVTFMEHIGDITTNGSVVGKDFFKDPGLHRTLAGDGIASLFAGLIGGPPNTTYSENTGVLAVTKVYSTGVIKLAAIFAICLGLFGKLGAIINGIPNAVKGGMSIMLFGMIAAVGMRTLVEAELDFKHSRNLIICALILVFGLGLSGGVTIGAMTFSGLFVAVLVGILANQILPENV